MTARVSDLHYVGLAVPDLDAERNFFGETWGLIEIGEQDGKVHEGKCCSIIQASLRGQAESSTRPHQSCLCHLVAAFNNKTQELSNPGR